VTAIEIGLVEVTEVFVGWLTWPAACDPREMG
jgi:hypothetical protein